MKKIKLAFATSVIAIAMIVALTAMKPESITVPPGHETLGNVGGSGIGPDKPNSGEWIDIVNLTECEGNVGIQFWITGTQNGVTTTASVLPPFIDINSGGLTYGDVRGILGFTSSSPITITNISFDIIINGTTHLGIFTYPNAPYNSVDYPTGLAAPCDCLHFQFDFFATPKKITITSGSCV